LFGSLDEEEDCSEKDSQKDGYQGEKGTSEKENNGTFESNRRDRSLDECPHSFVYVFHFCVL
jgi:hypothetical protein